MLRRPLPADPIYAGFFVARKWPPPNRQDGGGGTASHAQSSSFDIGDQSEVPAPLTARTRK